MIGPKKCSVLPVVGKNIYLSHKITQQLIKAN